MTEHPAASKMRANFRRHASGKISQVRNVTENGGESLADTVNHHINEHSALLASTFQNSEGQPLYAGDRTWVRWPASFGYTSWQTLTSNPVNFLLVFVPIGIAFGATHGNPTVVFILNFLAIIPLASLLSFATEEISVKLGQTLGGLMNATFGNAVELIVRMRLCSICASLMVPLGQHCCVEEWRNSHRASEHAGLHPLEYFTGSRLLLFRWRDQAQGTALQFDRRVDHVISHGRFDGVAYYPGYSLRCDGILKDA